MYRGGRASPEPSRYRARCPTYEERRTNNLQPREQGSQYVKQVLQNLQKGLANFKLGTIFNGQIKENNMPVMKNMRNIIRPVMWIVVIAFVGTIVLVWGGDVTRSKYKRGIIGSVNGQEISALDFSELYNEQLRRLGTEYEEMDEKTTKQVLDDTWNGLLRDVLLRQQAVKFKITVSDKELFEYMKVYPPLEFQQSEAFQTDGKFDYLKYLQALNNPNFPWARWEGYIRSNLRILKLQEMIIGLVRVTQPELRQDYVNSNEKIKVNYLFIPGSRFLKTTPQIAEQEIEQFYQKNQNQFKVGRRANLEYIVIAKQTSQDDVEAVRSELLRIRMEIEQGEDFAALAQDYSDDKATAQEGGDLGWLGKGKMIQPFEEALPNLNLGEISQPIRSQFGWHLVKLLEKRRQNGQDEFHLAHILLKMSPSEHTLDSLKMMAEDLSDQASKTGLKEVARKNNLGLLSTGLFSEEDMIPKLGYNPEASMFAFENKAGKVSQPIETKNDFLVLQIKERRPAGTFGIDEARENIKQKIAFKEALDLAFGEAEKIYQEADKSGNLELAAKKFSSKLIASDFFSRDSFPTQVVNSPDFVGTAFSLGQKNRISKPVSVDSGVYLIEFVSRIAANEQKFAQEKDSLYQRLLIQKKTQAYLDWFEQVKKQAKIEDYRNRFYRAGGI